ncbi:MAG: hypothetical protein DIJKHBIC_02922 [Thermoanaerobaculia bacterium]|nr:hypothetical protein [Thermoanaerobaculia bacterium]
MIDEVPTIKEIAERLKLAEKTVFSMAKRGELSTFQVRGQWGIRHADLDRRLEQQPKGQTTGTPGRDASSQKPETTGRGGRGRSGATSDSAKRRAG